MGSEGHTRPAFSRRRFIGEVAATAAALALRPQHSGGRPCARWAGQPTSPSRCISLSHPANTIGVIVLLSPGTTTLL
jgi:hypothetical protein